MAFALYLSWLYGSNPKQPNNPTELKTMFALFALLEKHMHEHLPNLCMDLIRGYYASVRGAVHGDAVSFVYDNIKNCNSKSFVVSTCSLHLLTTPQFPSGFPEMMAEGGPALADIAGLLIRYRRDHDRCPFLDSYLDRKESCAFHVHNATPKCRGPSPDRLKFTEEVLRDCGLE